MERKNNTRPDETQTWLTQEAADRLSAELKELEGPIRADVVKKIENIFKKRK